MTAGRGRAGHIITRRTIDEEMTMEFRKRWNSRTGVLLCIAVVCALCSLEVRGQAVLPNGFVDEPVVDDGLRFPVDFCFLNLNGEERFIVGQKDGVVKLVVNGVLQPEKFLDLSGQTASFFDRGLISCAVDTKFKNGMPYIYIAYAYKNEKINPEKKVPGRVSRFTVNADMTKAILSSEQVILGKRISRKCHLVPMERDVICCYGNTHCLGGMEMNSAGHLFVAVGDGAIPNQPDSYTMRAQNINALTGKVLRVKRTGKAVPGNPWYKDGRTKNDNASKVWSLGTRQPFRLHLDEVRGIPIIADVGWSTYEEVNWVEKGSNLGWPCWQGNIKNPQYGGFDDCKNFPRYGSRAAPLHFYPRTVGKSATGALRVNFPSWPVETRNRIFFVDYATNWMKYFRVDPTTHKKAGGRKDFGKFLNGPVQVRKAPKQSLYYIAINSQHIRKIRYAPDTTPPRVSLTSPPSGATTVETTANLVIIFSKPITGASLAGQHIVLTRTDGPGGTVETTYKYNSRSQTATISHEKRFVANASYRMTVKKVQDLMGREMVEPFTVDFTTGEGYTIYASDLNFVENINGLGPAEKDMANGGSQEGFSTRISIRTELFYKGIGCAPFSRVRVSRPDDSCKLFQATVGVDDSSTNLDGGRLYFNVKSDLGMRFKSSDIHPRPLNRTSAPLDIAVDVSDTAWLDLTVVDSGWGRIRQNLGSWGAARFRCGNFDANPPEIINFLPSEGATNVKVKNPFLRLVFNEAMDHSFILEGIRVRKVVGSGFTEIGWIPQVSDDSKKVTIRVSDVLDYQSRYEITATRAMRDLAGNRLTEKFSAIFRTEQAPATGEIVSLSELTPKSVTGELTSFKGDASPAYMANGWGRGTNGVEVEFFRKGISFATDAEVAYEVPAGCQSVTGYAGVDPIGGSRGCMVSVSYKSSSTPIQKVSVAPFLGAKILLADVEAGRTIVVGARGLRSGTASVCNLVQLHFRCASGNSFRFLSLLTPTRVEGRVKFNGRLGGGLLMVPKSRVASGIGLNQSVVFKNGIRMKAWTKAVYNIPGRCSKLISAAGVDTKRRPTPPDSSMQMFVELDGARSCETSSLSASSPAEKIFCPTRSASTLSLGVKKGGTSASSGGAVWGDPRLDCAPGTRSPSCEIVQLTDNMVIGNRLSFRGVAKDFLGNPLPSSSISWRVLLLHCGTDCHVHEAKLLNGVDRGSLQVEDHGDDFNFQVICTACVGGTCASTSANSFPSAVALTAQSQPAGLVVGVDSGNGPAPFTRKVVIGARVTVSTFPQQDGRTFSHWAHDSSIKDPIFSFVVKNTGPRTFKAVFT